MNKKKLFVIVIISTLIILYIISLISFTKFNLTDFQMTEDDSIDIGLSNQGNYDIYVTGDTVITIENNSDPILYSGQYVLEDQTILQNISLSAGANLTIQQGKLEFIAQSEMDDYNDQEIINLTTGNYYQGSMICEGKYQVDANLQAGETVYNMNAGKQGALSQQDFPLEIYVDEYQRLKLVILKQDNSYTNSYLTLTKID